MQVGNRHLFGLRSGGSTRVSKKKCQLRKFELSSHRFTGRPHLLHRMQSCLAEFVMNFKASQHDYGIEMGATVPEGCCASGRASLACITLLGRAYSRRGAISTTDLGRGRQGPSSIFTVEMFSARSVHNFVEDTLVCENVQGTPTLHMPVLYGMAAC